jgi:hypothetical protein
MGNPDQPGPRHLVTSVRRRLWRLILSFQLWFVRDVVIVLVIGLLVAGVQIWMDDRRAAQTQRLQNLQFVRSNTAPLGYNGPSANRPFDGMDLEGMIMSRLLLPDAHFDQAKLRNASFRYADLTRSDFDLVRSA